MAESNVAIPWDGGKPPDGLENSLSGNNLGDPAVVSELVGEFVTKIGGFGWECWDKGKQNPWLNDKCIEASIAMGKVFVGGDDQYTPTSWNTNDRNGLRTRARGMLQAWKNKTGKEYNIEQINPVSGVFYNLSWYALGAVKAASRGKDYALPEIMQTFVAILMGWPTHTDQTDEEPGLSHEEQLLKGHVHGYMRGNGTFVTEYVRKEKAKTYHPKKSEHGHDVPIYNPDEATDKRDWADASKATVFLPGGETPKELNGLAMESWRDHPRTTEGWDHLDDAYGEFDEDDYPYDKKKKLAAGVMIEEPDGRVWVISPTNKFGGYKNVFPKGTAEVGISLRANALKEVYEESGLKVKLTGVIGDFARTTSVMRLYRGVRTGGSPADMGWETQSVKLIPKKDLGKYLDAKADESVVETIKRLDNVGG